MPRNERLASAMQAAGLSPAALAGRVAVDDPKTVQRWVAGRQQPHRTTAQAVATEVGVPVGILWPGLGLRSDIPEELAHMHVSRRELQPGQIETLLRGAERHVDVLAYAATWLWDTVPGITGRLIDAAERGCQVRICLGDPDSAAVAARGAEEGIGEAMTGRCRLAIGYASPVVRAVPGTLRLHATTLYSSIFRFDEQLLVNWHIYGTPAADAPVFQFRIPEDGRASIATRLAAAFDSIWDSSVIYRPDEHAGPR
ncbi:hypothetical protein M6B22_11160 [Jatrophihabitans cynanchi]|uniref:HTH cro/C1-type domain-containing protein n=1 Tax=Jatrophihabitans cynanchi TaxID=2944128 RepID=A0ABY7JRD5_9ACTN|nr:hypothetical protein [Jatrophihabitans sp. SB3-54]WAX55119.1 hypothetical protein M6B22_11160 [Jatrophihabitans sp. SB3-54]